MAIKLDECTGKENKGPGDIIKLELRDGTAIIITLDITMVFVGY